MHGGKLLGIMAARRCYSLLGYFKGAEQNTKQSTSKDKEASTTTGCEDSEPKAKKERAFKEAWRKEFEWLSGSQSFQLDGLRSLEKSADN